VLLGVIFDFDGVLVDSERAHFESLKAALLENCGLAISFSEYTEHYLAYDDCGGIRRALERNGRDAPPALVNELARKKGEAYEDRLSRIPFLPGAKELVLGLGAAGVPLAIASGARRREIEVLLRSQGLLDMFSGIVAAEDVTRFKPHPEPYEKGRLLIGAHRSGPGVVAFEDSVPGLTSAKAAQLRVVAVTNSHPKERLALADWVVDSLAQVRVEDVEALARGQTVSGT